MSPLRNAIVEELVALREETATPWVVLDTLRQLIVHGRRNPRMASIIEAAQLMGVRLDTREGWLDFARRVADRLPPAEVA